jgi:glycosyltransferase involved in cell wall biosynthesis
MDTANQNPSGTAKMDVSRREPGFIEQVGVSVVLPVFNEEETIGALIDSIISTLVEADRSFEVVAVDDGSSDGTLAVLAALHKDHPGHLQVVQHLSNKGNGASVRSGIRVARYETVVCMDADGQHSPDDIMKLAGMIPPYDLVIGSRLKDYEGSLFRTIGNRFFNGFASWLSRTQILDLTSGFRAMRRSIALHFLPLFPSGFSAPTTTTLGFLKAGYNVAFLPIHVGQRVGGKSKIRLWADGSRFLILILRIVMIYDPLRIFLPTGLILAILGGLAWLAGVLRAGRLLLPNSTIVLFLAAVMTCLLGLMAGQIADSRIRYHGDETIMINGKPTSLGSSE